MTDTPNKDVETLLAVLRELHDAVEAKADVGKRRSLTVSPRMEDALAAAQKIIEGWKQC